MKIVVIGSGNVATHIAAALAREEHEIVQIYSRNIGNAQHLVDGINLINGCAYNKNLKEQGHNDRSYWCKATDDLSAIVTDADVYLFAVKDDALPILAEKICPKAPDALFLHTAGSVPMDVFAPYAKRYGVLYPMQTFSKNRHVHFRSVPCFIEGNDESAAEATENLACSISNSVHMLSSEKRKSLHLAAVFACNFTNHCYRLAEKVLQDAGIDFSLYLPLIDETAQKVHELKPQQAQTGPAIRYDETVINRHLSMLQDESMAEIYCLMSQSIHKDSLH